MIWGIDLGTTNSCVSYIDEYGNADVLPNGRGARTTPSVVFLDKDGYSYVVGEVAKNGQVIDYEQTVAFIKREMGKEFLHPTPFPNDLTPTEISARILKSIVTEANDAYDGKPCNDVIITCPAYFGTVARAQTKQAGEIAGLNVVRIINEPTASAIAYGQKFTDDTEKYVLVYDLGGGTFDITLIRIRGKSFKVIVTGGNARLGGYDWDLRLAHRLLGFYNSECSSNYSFDNNIAMKNQFMLFAEDVKKALTAKEQTKANIGWEGKSFQVSVSRKDFDIWTKDLLDETIMLTKKLLSEAEKRGVVLDSNTDILLVGGSSRMPQVAQRLHQEFEKTGCRILLRDPDECVAKGAALVGKITDFSEDIDSSDSSESPPIPHEAPFSFYDVTAKTYGTDFLLTSAENDQHGVYNIIFANSTLPVQAECTFFTIKDNQREVQLFIYESDARARTIMAQEAVVLDNEHHLQLPQNLPQNTPIEVRFEIDRQGILHVQANADSASVDFDLKVKGVMTKDEVQNAQKLLEMSTES